VLRVAAPAALLVFAGLLLVFSPSRLEPPAQDVTRAIASEADHSVTTRPFVPTRVDLGGAGVRIGNDVVWYGERAGATRGATVLTGLLDLSEVADGDFLVLRGAGAAYRYRVESVSRSGSRLQSLSSRPAAQHGGPHRLLMVTTDKGELVSVRAVPVGRN
jgi:hypothetical protein